MSNTRGSGPGTAGHAVGAGKGSAESAAASPWSTLFQAVKVVLGVRSALQVVGIDVVALLRRRGPLGAVSVFGAGFAVGAGVGALLAPTTGKAARRALRRRFRELNHDGYGLSASGLLRARRRARR